MSYRTLRFSTSSDEVLLIGDIYRAGPGAPAQPLVRFVLVRGHESASFRLPAPGVYRYEFDIRGAGPFDLVLTDADGRAVPCTGNRFDPDDPELGQAARFCVKSIFRLG